MSKTGNTKDFTQLKVCSNLTATILDGETDSDIIDLRGTSLLGISFPVGFDGTSITFTVSVDGGSTFQVYKNLSTGTTITPVVAANGFYATNPVDFAAVQYLKIIAGTSQTGDSVLTLVTRAL